MLISDQKIEKATKRCKRIAWEREEEEEKIIENLASKSCRKMAKDEFKHRCDEMRSEHTNSHFTSLLRLLVEEQNQNEQILLESLKQLKKSHLLLLSQGQLSDETKQAFDVSNNFKTKSIIDLLKLVLFRSLIHTC